MADSVLTLDKVSKKYGDFTAVDEISLDIPQGSIYGFLGPNGAGKTTTIRMILDILRPTYGSLSILGRPSALQVRGRIGYLPEEKGLYKKMKAWEVITYFATLKGMKKKVAKQRAHELLATYGLKDFTNSRVDALSKGMSQKVQVLSSVVHDPELVILDEPFSGLDPVNQEVLETLIKDLAGRGRTVIFSTHVMQHAERLCQRILLIAKGRKIFDGTVQEARNEIPRRVILASRADISPLQALEDVVGITEQDNGDMLDNGTRMWEVRIRDNTDPQRILQKCFESGITLDRFDYTQPSLHDVFVHLVGDDRGEASYR